MLKFDSIEKTMEYAYYEHFMEFWLPIYKKQVFKAKYYNEVEELIAIKTNVTKNIHLSESSKFYILKELGLRFLSERKG